MKRTSLPLRRRTFITLLGSASAAWPLTARAAADTAHRVCRIGRRMRAPHRILIAFALAVILVCIGPPSGRAGQRMALVIGNSSYRSVPALPNPRNDGADIGDAFERLGFSVRRLSDGSFDQMRRALLEFGRETRGADMAVVFFAGHGMEIGGENWLIPVDAELREESDAEGEAIPLRWAMLHVANAHTLGLVILDACRNNPFATKMQRGGRYRAVERGLARVEPSDNVLVAYASKDGTTASDGTGRNSPFTGALLNNVETPGLEISFLFRRVRDEVMAATKKEQQPFVYGSLSKNAIYLKEQPAKAEQPSGATGQMAVAAPLGGPSNSAGISDCDRLAASPSDTTRPAGIAGIEHAQVNPAQAVPACRTALMLRPTDARVAVQLARALSRAGGTANDLEAVRLLLKAADAGHSGGMLGLGTMYLNGRGVAKNEVEARRWYRKAAEAGNAEGMTYLAGLYAEGRGGVPKNQEEALRWYRKAAEAGFAFAMTQLGTMYQGGRGVPKDIAEATRWYLRSAESGNSYGLVALGNMYDNGAGVTKNEKEAVSWYRKAADAGNALGMTYLANMYRDGRGIAKDEAEAVRLYHRAIDANPMGIFADGKSISSIPMINLGFMYENGRGVAKDRMEAVRWFRRAAEAGNPNAADALKRLGQ